MMDIFNCVGAFNREVIGLPIPAVAAMLPPGRVEYASGHLDEESQELRDSANLEDQADAMFDSIYVATGRLVEMGFDRQGFYDGLAEVHAANMRRERGQKSTRPNSAGFDAVKPEGWVGPDLKRVLRDMHDRQSCVIRGERIVANHISIGYATPLQEWRIGPKVLQFGSKTVEPTSRGFGTFKAQRPTRILLIGHGRHGKDTVAEILRDRYGYTFTSSSLFCAEHVMLPAFQAAVGFQPYFDAEDCYNDRHWAGIEGAVSDQWRTKVGMDHRKFWFDAISAYCTPDKARLAREIFAAGNNIYVGIRDEAELRAVQALPDTVTVWVDASDRLPPEGSGSMNVTRQMADYVVNNNGSIENLRDAVDRLQSWVSA